MCRECVACLLPPPPWIHRQMEAAVSQLLHCCCCCNDGVVVAAVVVGAGSARRIVVARPRRQLQLLRYWLPSGRKAPRRCCSDSRISAAASCQRHSLAAGCSLWCVGVVLLHLAGEVCGHLYQQQPKYLKCARLRNK